GEIPSELWIQDTEWSGVREIGDVCLFMEPCSYWTGYEVQEVYATVLETPGGYNEDNVCITLRHSNGTRSTIDYLANGDTSASKESIAGFCGRGMAPCEGFWASTFCRAGKRSRYKSSGLDKGVPQELAAY